METTKILNTEKCGYSYFITVGKAIIACGLKGGVHKLNIERVVIVADNSVKNSGVLHTLGLSKAEYLYNVDADIYLEEGNVIAVHTSEEKFLQKLLPYVWELEKEDPRVEFYGACRERSAEDATKGVYEDPVKLAILEQQLELEQQTYKLLMEQLADSLIKATNEIGTDKAANNEIKVLNLQKRALNSQKKVLNLSHQIAQIKQQIVLQS